MTMSEEKNNVSRRDALKGIAGIGASLPILNTTLLADDHSHDHHGQAAKTAPNKAPYKAKFFNADQMALEPFDRAASRQLVDLGRADAAVDRPCHQDEASRCRRMVIFGHQRDRRQCSHARLAHGD